MSKRAGFLLILPLLAFSQCSDTSTKVCPAFTCDTAGNMLPEETCAKCDLSQNTCIIRPCLNSTLSCPAPKAWFSGESILCQQWDKGKWLASTYNEYYGVTDLTLGQICIRNDPYHRCSFENSLECHCSADMCNCVEALGYGSPCELDDICFQGYVCNNGICLKMNSLEAGVKVTNPTACMSNSVVHDGYALRCSYSPRSLGIIPKECETCLDCSSADGTAYSDCICGLNGVAYCDLLPGDDPRLEYVDLAPNQRFDGVIYWDFVVKHYPYLHDPPDCLDEVWRDFAYYDKGAPNYSEARIVQLMLMGLLA